MNMPKIGCVNHDCDKCKKTRQILKDMEQAHYRLQKRYAELESKVGAVQELAGYFYLDDGQWKQAHDPVSFPGCTKLYTTPPTAQPAPVQEPDRYAVMEVLRKALNKLPRYSFLLGEPVSVRRVPDRYGAWIEWNAAHELFDATVIDYLLQATPPAAPVQPEFPQCAEDLSPKTLVYTAKQVERMLATPPSATEK